MIFQDCLLISQNAALERGYEIAFTIALCILLVALRLKPGQTLRNRSATLAHHTRFQLASKAAHGNSDLITPI
jgi:hypothetical protein